MTQLMTQLLFPLLATLFAFLAGLMLDPTAKRDADTIHRAFICLLLLISLVLGYYEL